MGFGNMQHLGQASHRYCGQFSRSYVALHHILLEETDILHRAFESGQPFGGSIPLHRSGITLCVLCVTVLCEGRMNRPSQILILLFRFFNRFFKRVQSLFSVIKEVRPTYKLIALLHKSGQVVKVPNTFNICVFHVITPFQKEYNSGGCGYMISYVSANAVRLTWLWRSDRNKPGDDVAFVTLYTIMQQKSSSI